MTGKANTTPRPAHYPARFRAPFKARFIAAARYLIRFIIPDIFAGLLLILFCLVILPFIMSGI